MLVMLNASWVGCLKRAIPAESPAHATLVAPGNVHLVGLAALPDQILFKCGPDAAWTLLVTARRVCPDAVPLLQRTLAAWERAEVQRIPS